MQQVNWFERKFEFSGNQNIMPSLIERLEGAPIRLMAKMKLISPSDYTIKPNGKWSILEHIGHLSDLEPLWQLRLDELLNGKKELSAADLENKLTHNANHNAKAPAELLNHFDSLRKATLTKLKNLKEEDVFRSALHPRLKTPMRTIDLFTFVAEHDDHHLSKITELSSYKN
ncbi:MAG TPA: DinB family protein [Bacteroidia bacterium]